MAMRLFRVVPCCNENENADHAWHSGKSTLNRICFLLRDIITFHYSFDQRWTWVGSIHGLVWQIIWVGLDRLNRLAASKVEAIEMVRWGLRAGYCDCDWDWTVL